jgi:zinc protease
MRNLLAASLILLSTTASAATVLDDFVKGIRTATLPNGLTVITRETPGGGVVAVNTWVKAGYFHESDEVAGMAHLFEHMLFKGSKKFPSAEEISRALAAVGGRSNAGTIYDVTNYYYIVPREGFRKAMEVQADAIANPLFDAAELKKESEVVIEESNRKYDNAPAVSLEHMYATAFEKHRFKRWRIGSNEVLRNIKRDDLLAFFQTLYRPENMVLVVTGDVKHDEVMRVANETFGLIPKGTLKKVGGPAEPEQKEFRYGTSSGDIRQAYTVMGWHTPGTRNSDELTLDLLSYILGQGRSSRLFRQVVAPEAASTAFAAHFTFEDVGMFFMSASFDEKNRAETDRRLIAEVERIKKDGPTDFEMALAKNVIESERVLALEDALGQSEAIGAAATRGGYRTLATDLEKLASITAADVQAAARRYLTLNNMTLYHYRTKEAPEMTGDAALQMVKQSMAAAPRPLQAAAMKTPDATQLKRATGTAAEPKTSKLSNNVTLIVEERSAAPVVSAAILFRGGRNQENSSNAGITQLLTRAMRRGTSTRSASQIDQEIEFLGADLSPLVTLDYFGYTVTATARNFRPAAALAADIVLNPTFPDAGVNEEKFQQTAAIKRAADSATVRPVQMLNEVIYRNHPYALPPDGYATSVDAIDSAALRAWWQRSVAADGAVVIISGDIAAADARAVAESLFGKMPASSTAKFTTLAAQPPASRLESIEYRDRKQSAIVVGFPAVPITSPDWPRLRLLQEVGSGGNPLLYNELRGKRSLAYVVFSQQQAGGQGGAFVAYLASEARKEEEARQALIDELRRFAKDAIKAEDLALAKSSLSGILALTSQTNVDHVTDLARAHFYNLGLDFTRRYINDLQKLTLDELRAVAAKYLNNENYAVAIVRGK